MKKNEFVTLFAEKAEISKRDAEILINVMFDSIQEVLINNDEILIPGFGKFEIKQRAARQGRNPRTGEIMEISASNVPNFKAAKQLKNAINN